MPKLKTIIFIQLANWIPVVGLVLLVVFLDFFTGNFYQKFALALLWIYFLPPILYRFWISIRGAPEGSFEIDTGYYFTWWVGVQLQAHYLRFPFLEEVLRLFPVLYSSWLRLWGANIGRAVYWAPGTTILDRGYLSIGDFVIVGVGSRFAAHLVGYNDSGKYQLYLKSPKVGNYCVLGGYCGVGPGAFVAENEMLPPHVLLAPDYKWISGSKKSPTAEKN